MQITVIWILQVSDIFQLRIFEPGTVDSTLQLLASIVLIILLSKINEIVQELDLMPMIPSHEQSKAAWNELTTELESHCITKNSVLTPHQ